MKSISTETLAMACAAVVAMPSFATEREWIGESGGSWYVAANWSPSGVPKDADTVVFRPSGELTVAISGGVAVCRAGEIRFESGTTCFAYDSTAISLYMGSETTNILYVAEGAEAVVSNRFSAITGKRLRRTGKGRLTIVPRTVEWWKYSYDIPGCDFVEGETVLAAGPNYPLASIPIHVCSGAVVRCEGEYRLNTTQDVLLDEGAILDCGGATQYTSALTGSGIVTNFIYYTLCLNSGSCMFAGKFFQKNGSAPTVKFAARPSGMSDEDWGFVVGGSNTLADSRLTLPKGAGRTLRFAPGVCNFWIKDIIGSENQLLTLEDVNGGPVTVRGGFYNTTTVPRFKGCGNFLLHSLSAYIRSSDIVANMTGSLGASGGATLTIGNDTAATWPDISGLGGFIVERGTVAFKNKNVEDSAIHGTVVFRDARAKMTATDALTFGAGGTVRFEIPESGLDSGVTPISGPTISFDATTALEADVAKYRKTQKTKTRLTLATASSVLALPDETLARANAAASSQGCRFVKSGLSLVLEVSGSDGFMIIVR